MESLVVGIDEAGRGPLAGPVVIAAVSMQKEIIINGVKDSKKLSFSQRDFFFDEIIKNCENYDIAIIDNDIIDDINILQATMSGMKICLSNLNCDNNKIYIDGNYFKFSDGSHKRYNYETIVGGDDKIFQISCASILAKVIRDRYLISLSDKFPEYNFSKNKGYPTPEHIRAIKNHGISKIHRKSFCNKFLYDSK